VRSILPARTGHKAMGNWEGSLLALRLRTEYFMLVCLCFWAFYVSQCTTTPHTTTHRHHALPSLPPHTDTMHYRLYHHTPTPCSVSVRFLSFFVSPFVPSFRSTSSFYKQIISHHSYLLFNGLLVPQFPYVRICVQSPGRVVLIA
jgi:hypothetical protein